MLAAENTIEAMIQDPHPFYREKIIKLAFRKPKQAKIATNTWVDSHFKQLSAAAPNAQTLWMRLSIAPESGKIPGLIAATIEHIAHSLGWSVQATRSCWDEIEAIGWGFADWEAGLIWLPNTIFQNGPTNPNVVKSWWRHWDELPKCGLLYQAWDRLDCILALRGKKWHAAFVEASDIIFEGAYTGDAFSDVHASFGRRVIDFAEFKKQTAPSHVRTQQPTSPPEDKPPDRGKPPPSREDNGASTNDACPTHAPKRTEKSLGQQRTSTSDDHAAIGDALERARVIAWKGTRRRSADKPKLGTNEKKHIDAILQDGYSVDDIMKVLLRKGEDAYRHPFYKDRNGRRQSNRALVSIGHIARPGKMDYYLSRDELDEHMNRSKSVLSPPPYQAPMSYVSDASLKRFHQMAEDFLARQRVNLENQSHPTTMQP